MAILLKTKKILFQRYTFLLMSIVLCLIVLPIIEGVWATIMYHIFLIFVFASSTYSVIENRKILSVILVLFGLSVVTNILDFAGLDYLWTSYTLVFQPIFLILAIILILKQIISSTKVGFDIIMGSICVYLLTGFAFAIMYIWLININSAAFNINYSTYHPFDLFYFSFVTISTLGYGDITPNITIAKSLSILEAIFGQFYIAILVARLVSLSIITTKQHCTEEK